MRLTIQDSYFILHVTSPRIWVLCGMPTSVYSPCDSAKCVDCHRYDWWFFLFTKYTHTHTQLFYGSVDFVRDNPDEPVPEETFTHSHLSWLSIVPYLLHPSTTIHSILPAQSTRLTVPLHNLSPSPLWSTSYLGTLYLILHTFLHPTIVLPSQHMPIPSQHTHTHTIVLLLFWNLSGTTRVSRY